MYRNNSNNIDIDENNVTRTVGWSVRDPVGPERGNQAGDGGCDGRVPQGDRRTSRQSTLRRHGQHPHPAQPAQAGELNVLIRHSQLKQVGVVLYSIPTRV